MKRTSTEHGSERRAFGIGGAHFDGKWNVHARLEFVRSPAEVPLCCCGEIGSEILQGQVAPGLVS
jgi:hypothetical protein